MRVKVAAAAFNPIDYQMRRGSTESKLLKSPILGREMGGTLTEVGELVTGFKIGDEVFGYVGSLASNGTYAEEVVVPASLIACIPRNLDFAGAAAIRMVGLTASQAVRRCPIKQGAKVFVAGGAGGVGSMVIRFLMLNGINNIFSTCGNRESRRRLNSMGLSEEKILDYRDAELAEKLKKAAGGSFDVCFDTVGGKMSECSAEIVRVNGIYVDITFLTTERARRALFDKACTVLNVANFAYALHGNAESLRFYGEELTRLAELIQAGELNATPIEIVGGFSVETVSRAHEMLENNLTHGRKLIMTID